MRRLIPFALLVVFLLWATPQALHIIGVNNVMELVKNGPQIFEHNQVDKVKQDTTGTIQGWLRQLETPSPSTPSTGTTEGKRLQELEREVAHLKHELEKTSH